MTTSQNRQPKGISTGGQFAPGIHAEATLLLDPAHRPVILAPGDSDTFTELADGDVIETLNVSRSDDGSGYWVSPAKTVNIASLITDSDPRLNGKALDAWLEHNSPVIEDFLAERYEAVVTTDEGWSEAGIECTAQLPDGPLTESQVVDGAWNGTKIVQLHNESDHGSFGSENLGRLIIERVEGATVIEDPYVARGAGLRLGHDVVARHVDERHGKRPVSDAVAVAIAKELNGIRSSRGIIAYPAVGRLATRGYVDNAAVDLELERALTANQQSFYPDRKLARRIESLRTWLRDGGDNA
ncbi:hypothetical protein [Paenarthrobacter sp. YJN-5]|uniref:hypothetical protein n=1 Tax=Paenarthrobacter sp. YJN-5 TaxID=2735316 RepID=UPI001D0CC68E|nr:hypothetical protein [Paenarthrobacter sp. YJN-5]